MYTIIPSRIDRQKLIADIKEIALLHGEFTLRSGQKSNYYLDKYRFESQPILLAKIADAMQDLLLPAKDFDRLAGIELGGIPLVTALSFVTGKPSIFVRNKEKEYATTKLIEGVFQPGEKIILVEDVVTTGGAALKGVKAMQDAGLDVLGVVAVLDRKQGGAEAFAQIDVPFFALFTKDDLGV